MRDQRILLDSDYIEACSLKVTENVLSTQYLQQAKKVALYNAHENEVDTIYLMRQLSQQGVELYLPVMSDGSLLFYSYDINEQLSEAQYGIMQPVLQDKQPIDWSELDVMCLPLVAFDTQCFRLGRGGGFYDRALASSLTQMKNKPWLIGLAYAFQCVNKLPIEPWDVPLDAVSTESHVYYHA